MAGLQDSTALISELTSKLSELDSKVAAYRLDMAAEYLRHSEEVLRSVPDDVAYRVSQAIAESLTKFPALYPPASLSPPPLPLAPLLEAQLPCKRGSPPPILPHTSGNPKEPAILLAPDTRGPHDRELEFQGLFTPTYLPLLEKFDRPPHTPTAPSGPATASQGPAPAPLAPSAALSSDSDLPEAATPDCQTGTERTLRPEISPRRHRPSPLRSTTNTSVDSAVSDSSSSTTLRKSALRRFSGAPRTPDSPRDPRRVRFDFQGQEVLPSSSPRLSPTALPETDDTNTRPPPVQVPYVTSLGDVKGEQDDEDSQLGLPKKVSSTQALRALSKAPLDEGTVWTIVNTGSASDLSSNSDADKVRANTATNSASHFDKQDNMNANSNNGLPKGEARSQTRGDEEAEAGSSKPRLFKREQVFDDEEDSDDEANVLFMTSKKGGQKTPLPVSSKAASRKTVASLTPRDNKSASPMAIEPGFQKQATTSTASPMPIASSMPLASSMSAQAGIFNQTTTNASVSSRAKAQAKAQNKNRHKFANHAGGEDEAVFDFDDDDDEGDKFISAKPGSEGRYMYFSESSSSSDSSSSSSESEDDTALELPANKGKGKSSSSVVGPSCSPPIEIADRRPITPEHRVPKKVPRKPAGSRPPSTSIGTYDGKPVTPHVVKDKKLRDQIKSQEGHVPFFVGSVNGNSGVDASNVKSYQASVMSPTTASGGFASGSFAERLMWERSRGLTYDSEGEGRKVERGPKNDKKRGG